MTTNQTHNGAVLAQSPVRPIVVTITQDDKFSCRSFAQYQWRVAARIRAAGVPLGMMLDLARASEMTRQELDRVWIKEFARHDIHHVDITEKPDGTTEVLIWPNESREARP